MVICMLGKHVGEHGICVGQLLPNTYGDPTHMTCNTCHPTHMIMTQHIYPTCIVTLSNTYFMLPKTHVPQPTLGIHMKVTQHTCVFVRFRVYICVGGQNIYVGSHMCWVAYVLGIYVGQHLNHMCWIYVLDNIQIICVG